MSTAASDPFGWAGATIEAKYRVDEVVGEGGFGVVYRGQHLGFDEPVAIKVLKVPGSLQGTEREEFLDVVGTGPATGGGTGSVNAASFAAAPTVANPTAEVKPEPTRPPTPPPPLR